MIDRILDFSIDHVQAFIAIFVVVVASAAFGMVWAYGRYHERATRRRSAKLND